MWPGRSNRQSQATRDRDEGRRNWQVENLPYDDANTAQESKNFGVLSKNVGKMTGSRAESGGPGRCGQGAPTGRARQRGIVTKDDEIGRLKTCPTTMPTPRKSQRILESLVKTWGK